MVSHRRSVGAVAAVVAAGCLAVPSAAEVASDRRPLPTAKVLPAQELILPAQGLVLPVSSFGGSVEVQRAGVTLDADVLFAFGSATLRPAARGRIRAAADAVRTAAPRAVRITGYTDSRGTRTSNLRLSRRRAEAVRRSLTAALGDDAPPLRTDGRGEADPIAANTTKKGQDAPAGRARNRRVEIRYR